MSKLLKSLRSVLKALGRKAKISLSVALSVPGFLKIEVEYARTLGRPPCPCDAERISSQDDPSGPTL